MKKMIISFMVTMVLAMGLLTSQALAEDVTSDGNSAVNMNQTVKVGLKYGSTALAGYNISSDNGFYIGSIANGAFTTYLPITAYTTITALYENGSIVLKAPDGTVILQDLGSYIIFPLDYASASCTVLKLASVQYRGGICFTKNSGGTLNAINVLNSDQYVYGVLNSEMNHGHPMEALKAQAIAARSFANSNKNRHSDYGFDVCTNTHCQVYKGYSDEYKETNQAADETAGLALYYKESPVSAYYYKNSGGYTQDIKDVWGSSAGYLKAVKDKYSPDYPWSATYTFAEIESKLSAAGNNIGTITRIDITGRNQSGAVENLKFTGTGGTITYSKEKIRTLFGATVIKSTMFSLGNSATGTTNDEGISQKLEVLYLSNGTSSKKFGEDSVYVIGADNKVQDIDASKLYVSNGSQVYSISSGETATKPAESTTSEYVTASPVVFTGKGYGHGIGMPQDSAIEMAKQGFTYDAILKYYYTGIEIK